MSWNLVLKIVWEPCVNLHLWRYEYDYKCNRYALVMTTVAVKQLHVTSLNGSTFLYLMY